MSSNTIVMFTWFVFCVRKMWRGKEGLEDVGQRCEDSGIMGAFIG